MKIFFFFPVICNPGDFSCLDGKECIRSAYKCNGYNDCGDHSDERNCPGKFNMSLDLNIDNKI